MEENDSRSQQDSTGGRYARDRLDALHERVEALEACVQRAAVAIGEQHQPTLALEILKSGLMETFKGAILCSAEMTDEQLDYWLSEIAKHEAEQAAAEREGTP